MKIENVDKVNRALFAQMLLQTCLCVSYSPHEKSQVMFITDKILKKIIVNTVNKNRGFESFNLT